MQVKLLSAVFFLEASHPVHRIVLSKRTQLPMEHERGERGIQAQISGDTWEAK